MAIGEKIVAFLLGIKRSLIWRNLIELTPLSNRTLEWREGINFLVIKTMALPRLIKEAHGWFTHRKCTSRTSSKGYTSKGGRSHEEVD
jgi:hypothetical protein